MENQVQCPECKSYKVESFKYGATKFGLSCIISAGLIYYFLMPPQGISIEDPALIRPFVFAGSLSEDPAGQVSSIKPRFYSNTAS